MISFELSPVMSPTTGVHELLSPRPIGQPASCAGCVLMFDTGDAELWLPELSMA
jgi:hypothetical protein